MVPLRRELSPAALGRLALDVRNHMVFVALTITSDFFMLLDSSAL